MFPITTICSCSMYNFYEIVNEIHSVLATKINIKLARNVVLILILHYFGSALNLVRVHKTVSNYTRLKNCSAMSELCGHTYSFIKQNIIRAKRQKFFNIRHIISVISAELNILSHLVQHKGAPSISPQERVLLQLAYCLKIIFKQ